MPTVPVTLRLLNVAAPVPSVRTGEVPLRTPPGFVLSAAVIEMLACATELPLASRACTTIGGDRSTALVAVSGGAVVKVNWVAAPALSVIVPLVTPASEGALKARVWPPAVPEMARSVKVARPLEVVAIAVKPIERR